MAVELAGWFVKGTTTFMVSGRIVNEATGCSSEALLLGDRELLSWTCTNIGGSVGRVTAQGVRQMLGHGSFGSIGDQMTRCKV